jgi:hypothetical protein
MRRSAAGDIVLKVLGLLLLVAAVLKRHELLTIPAANKDLRSWRSFLILQVEFEPALGIWLLSAVFKPQAWPTSPTWVALFRCANLAQGTHRCGNRQRRRPARLQAPFRNQS